MQKNDTPKPQRRSFRIPEVAETTGLSEGMIKKKIREGELRATHVGRAVIILAEDLEAWLKAGASASA